MKPKDPIWNFYQIDEDSNKLTTRCKDCNATVSAKELRMRSHREKCPSAARPAKRPLADLDPEPDQKLALPVRLNQLPYQSLQLRKLDRPTCPST